MEKKLYYEPIISLLDITLVTTICVSPETPPGAGPSTGGDWEKAPKRA